jgi:hypothetical protein
MYGLYEAQGKNDSFDRICQLKASAFQKRKKKLVSDSGKDGEECIR